MACGKIICTAGGNVAERSGAFAADNSGYDLVERTVAAYADDEVKLAAVKLRKLRCIAALAGRKNRHGIVAFGKNSYYIGQKTQGSAPPRNRINNKQKFFQLGKGFHQNNTPLRSDDSCDQKAEVSRGNREQQAVNSVHNAAVTGDKVAVILETCHTLYKRGGKIADLTEARAYKRSERAAEDIDIKPLLEHEE